MKELFATNTRDLSEAPDAFRINEKWRLEVLARPLEGIMKMRHTGVDQWDLATRKIYLVPPQCQALVTGKALPRVVLIDYNASFVWDRTQVKEVQDLSPGILWRSTGTNISKSSGDGSQMSGMKSPVFASNVWLSSLEGGMLLTSIPSLRNLTFRSEVNCTAEACILESMAPVGPWKVYRQRCAK